MIENRFLWSSDRSTHVFGFYPKGSHLLSSNPTTTINDDDNCLAFFDNTILHLYATRDLIKGERVRCRLTSTIVNPHLVVDEKKKTVLDSKQLIARIDVNRSQQNRTVTLSWIHDELEALSRGLELPDHDSKDVFRSKLSPSDYQLYRWERDFLGGKGLWSLRTLLISYVSSSDPAGSLFRQQMKLIIDRLHHIQKILIGHLLPSG